MKKKDGRKISHAAREEIRKRAVERVLNGESPEAVISALGFHRSRIYQWLKDYREGGEAGLETKPIPGRPPKVADHYADLLRDLVRDNPLQYDFHDALWTREMIQEVLAKKWGIKVSIGTVGNILKRFGITSQKPRFKAYEQDQDKVDQWFQETWPEIQREAKRNKAQVFFGDEANIRTDYHRGSTWGVKGETPVVEKTGKRYGVNMISAISPGGRLRFMVTDKTVNAEVFLEFLKRFTYQAEHPIYLVLDGHPVHRSKRVRQFAEATNGKLKLFYLPPYSPELNPDELVWHHVKAQKLGRRIVKTKQELFERVRSVLRSLQKDADKLKAFFYEKNVKYALSCVL